MSTVSFVLAGMLVVVSHHYQDLKPSEWAMPLWAPVSLIGWSVIGWIIIGVLITAVTADMFNKTYTIVLLCLLAIYVSLELPPSALVGLYCWTGSIHCNVHSWRPRNPLQLTSLQYLYIYQLSLSCRETTTSASFHFSLEVRVLVRMNWTPVLAIPTCIHTCLTVGQNSYRCFSTFSGAVSFRLFHAVSMLQLSLLEKACDKMAASSCWHIYSHCIG